MLKTQRVHQENKCFAISNLPTSTTYIDLHEKMKYASQCLGNFFYNENPDCANLINTYPVFNTDHHLNILPGCNLSLCLWALDLLLLVYQGEFENPFFYGSTVTGSLKSNGRMYMSKPSIIIINLYSLDIKNSIYDPVTCYLLSNISNRNLRYESCPSRNYDTHALVVFANKWHLCARNFSKTI